MQTATVLIAIARVKLWRKLQSHWPIGPSKNN